jgi:EF-P beta-lysylation protein EpmB
LDKDLDSVSRTQSLPNQDWREQIRSGFHDPASLLSYLGLSSMSVGHSASFPLRVPRAFAQRMRPKDPQDPLLLQVLPDPDEGTSNPGFSIDPVGDLESRSAPAILHKYRGRVLVMTTGACAVHCRYCFRQHYPYSGQTVNSRRWEAAIAYLRGHEDIEEVILSGGDPFMLATRKLRRLSDDLSALPTIRRLRIHTRMPVVLPDRVTSGLLGWLSDLTLPTVIVIHANHAREFDGSVDQALARLGKTGAFLLNQSVLMKGINDNFEDLKQLMERSFGAGVLPYYLHQLDRVAGSARFEVSDSKATSLIKMLRESLPGYLVPRLVREERDQPNKTPVL